MNRDFLSQEARFEHLLQTRLHPRNMGPVPIGRDLGELFLDFCARYARDSAAQLFQDLFVTFATKAKPTGFFVEFGATDGVSLSNTLLLERNGWKGILAEPARSWHARLKSNRQAAVDFRCVWGQSGEYLDFVEAEELEFSTISSFAQSDFNRRVREQVRSNYQVETVSLNDLLAQHSAPAQIDYLSLDTEGSELEILESFDFAKYRIGIITVEHNFTENREKIDALLRKNGFFSVFRNFSKWDDWYLNSAVHGG